MNLDDLSPSSGPPVDLSKIDRERLRDVWSRMIAQTHSSSMLDDFNRSYFQEHLGYDPANWGSPNRRPNYLQLDPSVKYRFVGREGLNDIFAKGSIDGSPVAWDQGKLGTKYSTPFFSQGVPYFDIASGVSRGETTSSRASRPFLLATLGDDWRVHTDMAKWKKDNIFPQLPSDPKLLEKYLTQNGSELIQDQSNIISVLQPPRGGQFSLRSNSPNIVSDEDLFWRVQHGKATPEEINRVFGSGALDVHNRPEMRMLNQEQALNLAFPNDFLETIPLVKPEQGVQYPAKKIPLDNRPFSIFEYTPKGPKLIEEGNNDPVVGGVKPIPTTIYTGGEVNNLPENLKIEIPSGFGKYNDAQLEHLKRTGGQYVASPRGMIDWSLKNSRKGFVNYDVLGGMFGKMTGMDVVGKVANELATPTPFEEAMGMFAKKPTAEGAMNFAKFAKANPAWVAGQTLNTLGRVGAVAGMAIAPSQAMSRRDKLAYDFYSKPENQRLSRDEESKINAYLGVQAGLENALDVATLGSGIPDYILHNETPWWASEIAQGKQYEHAYQGQGFRGK